MTVQGKPFQSADGSEEVIRSREEAIQILHSMDQEERDENMETITNPERERGNLSCEAFSNFSCTFHHFSSSWS